MVINKRIIINFLTVILMTVSGVDNIMSQITENGSFYSEQAEYDGEPSFDMIFYYEDLVNGSLECVGEFYTYSWAKYDANYHTWNDFSNSKQIMITEQGGYRVIASDGRYFNNTFHCWVFIPKLNDIEAFIEKGDAYNPCIDLVPAAKCDSIPLIYYNPETDKSNYVKYGRQFNWEWEEETMQGQSIKIEAPYENTTYKVTVEDKFKNTSSSEVDYTAIAVLAKIKAEILKADVLHEVHDSTNFASAPVEILFTDESKGFITQLSWQIGSGFSTERNPFYVFTVAGTQIVTMTVSNDMCESVDSMRITVMELLLEFPNAFTPNGDGINDEFRAAYRSVKKYKITVVNRWGRVVYASTDPSKGWDGNIGDKQAPVGVYYYFAEAEGYNKGERIKRTGPLHLIREK